MYFVVLRALRHCSGRKPPDASVSPVAMSETIKILSSIGNHIAEVDLVQRGGFLWREYACAVKGRKVAAIFEIGWHSGRHSKGNVRFNGTLTERIEPLISLLQSILTIKDKSLPAYV